MSHTRLVAGLGNPGPRYAGTRHNVGAMVVEELARRAGEQLSPALRRHATVATTRIGPVGLGVVTPDSQPVVLMRPTTYMNDSGRAVRAVAEAHGVVAGDVVVVHDELDLDLGQLRLKAGGGDNGHNGLRSVRAHLGSGEFLRVRVGVGRPPGRRDPADFVLSRFPASQREEVALVVAEAADAVECLLTAGLTAAQNRFNR